MNQMSHLQGPSSVACAENSNPSSYVGYWPGHIVAECLIEEEEEEDAGADLVGQKKAPSKSRKPSESSFRRLTKKLSRTDSEPPPNKSPNDINNNNKNSDIAKNDTDMIKAAKLLNKLKPGSSFSAIVSSMVPFEILTRILRRESAKLRGVDSDLMDSGAFDEFVYDEFGFKVDADDERSQRCIFAKYLYLESIFKYFFFVFPFVF